MSASIKDKGLLLANYGNPVTRASATIPATGSPSPIFSVVGGNVLITNILGQVTTAIQNQACTMAVNYLNTASTATLDIATTISIANAAVGTLYGAPTVGSVGVVAAYVIQNNEFILPAGSIRLVTSATNTGAMKWYINYIALDPGAYVATA